MMRADQPIEIALGGRGGVCIVDADIAKHLLAARWRPCKDGYAVTSHLPPTIFMHRHIVGALPGQYVDHIDRNRLNNRRANLRLVDARGNNINRARKRNGTSQFRGLSWVPKAGKWQVLVDGRYIGLFSDELDGARHWLAVAEHVFDPASIAAERAAIDALSSGCGRAPITRSSLNPALSIGLRAGGASIRVAVRHGLHCAFFA